jgi:hypothetical protein
MLKADERFWTKVQKTDDCWLWTDGCDPQGYGRFSLNRKPVLAHRFAWYLYYGEWPITDALDHTCLNTSCVRVEHLEDVGRKINTIRYYERLGDRCVYGHTDRYTNKKGYKICRECNRIRGRGGKPKMQTDAGA